MKTVKIPMYVNIAAFVNIAVSVYKIDYTQKN